ncbi:MAG: hypothetical protein HOE90_06925 [Bacteriovoracaceae bacterium]|jgi:hypothetical protein|nr:hypothetical protein [Bacteriovoracaceae bacterium]
MNNQKDRASNIRVVFFDPEGRLIKLSHLLSKEVKGTQVDHYNSIKLCEDSDKPIDILCISEQLYFASIKDIKHLVTEDSKLLLFADIDSLKDEVKSIFSDKISGIPFSLNIIDFDWPPGLQKNVIKNVIRSGKQLINSFQEIDDEISPLMTKLQKELFRVKKIHEYFLPKRFGNLKGLKIASKYNAGSSAGGEFFDSIKIGGKLLILMSSCQSYLTSSILLSHFAMLQDTSKIDESHLTNFIQNLYSELKDSGLDTFQDGHKLSMVLLKIDLSKLSYESYTFGNFLITTHENVLTLGNHYDFCPSFLEKSKMTGRLERGNRLIIVSPGFRKNCSDHIEGRQLYEYIYSLGSKAPTEIINELFFQLSKNREDSFFDFDSSGLIIEVEENVFIEV